MSFAHVFWPGPRRQDTTGLRVTGFLTTGPKSSQDGAQQGGAQQQGHVDLSKPAFLQLGTESEGYLGTGNGEAVGIISWKYVPCAVTGNVHVLLKEPSNTGWNQFLVANHRTPIAKFEAQINGSWVTGTRQTYNYFDVGSSLSFPVSVRVTDTNGAVITGCVKSGSADQDIGAQFPSCIQ
jgi:expansin (peptidoglycan-binding protein)